MSTSPLDAARWSAARLLLLDIEGTLSSISFVKEVMYPYALDRLTRLAHESWAQPDFQRLLDAFPSHSRRDADTLLAHVQDLTRRDVKAGYLKQLQGHLWTTGFASGHLKTPLFADVLPMLEAWKHQGRSLVIFSSGSVQAQHQFFSHVQHGSATQDLTPLFSAHYDTLNAGSKLDQASYQKICADAGQPPSHAAFLTDSEKEAEAAANAGLYPVLVHRPGNAPLSAETKTKFAVVDQLTDLP